MEAADRSADRKAVAVLSAAAREKLRPWAELDPEKDAEAIFFMAIKELGDMEGIPLLIKTMKLDADQSPRRSKRGSAWSMARSTLHSIVVSLGL